MTFAHDDDDDDEDNNCEDKNFDGCGDDAPPSGVEVLASHGQGRRRTTGTQVVHRHPNGLCVITAGNVLELSIGGSIESDRNSDGGAPPPAPTVASVRYHVSVCAYAQSARGKLHVRNKKWPKRDGNGGGGSDDRRGKCEGRKRRWRDGCARQRHRGGQCQRSPRQSSQWKCRAT